MAKLALRIALAFLLLIPAQAVIFNHLALFNIAIPFVFIYIVIMLPVTLGTNLSTSLGFLAGLLLDIFCDTPGVCTLATTVLAFVRKPIFHLYVSIEDDLAGRSPSAATMGAAAYMKFLITMVLIFCTIVFTIEACQFFNFRLLILRIAASAAYTFLLIYALSAALHRSAHSS